MVRPLSLALATTTVLVGGLTAAVTGQERPTGSVVALPSAVISSDGAPLPLRPVRPPQASPTPEPSSAPSLGPLPDRAEPDVLVSGPTTMTASAVARLGGLTDGGTSLAYAAGTVTVGDQPVLAVGVDPAAFRAFAAAGTAEATDVWQAVARGEAVASHAAAERLGLTLGAPVIVTPATGGAPVTVRLGALATTGLPATDLVVDGLLGRQLGLPADTAVLLSGAGGKDPVALAGRVRAVTGDLANVKLLAPPPMPTAFLTGGKAAKAFGAFSYTYFPDGTIQPDAAWVKANIVTETVPIMGRVTCHRLMLPQLRGALSEVEAAGLGTTLHHFDGCYVPRFIERNPDRSISLHTWGIAIDMDAATNYRGIKGTMDPGVVEIFKRWGFRWGGDWSYTDPMHFELGAILTAPR